MEMGFEYFFLNLEPGSFDFGCWSNQDWPNDEMFLRWFMDKMVEHKAIVSCGNGKNGLKPTSSFKLKILSLDADQTKTGNQMIKCS